MSLPRAWGVWRGVKDSNLFACRLVRGFTPQLRGESTRAGSAGFRRTGFGFRLPTKGLPLEKLVSPSRHACLGPAFPCEWRAGMDSNHR